MANGRILSNQYLNYSALQNETVKLATKYKVTIDAIAIRFCMDCFKGSTVLSGANNLAHFTTKLKSKRV